MTKQEIQLKYATLAAKVGDLYMRLSSAEAVVRSMKGQMDAYSKERNDLEEALKTATDETPSEVVEATPVEG